MAKLKIVRHGQTIFKEVEELFFHYPSERGHGYVFEISNGEISVGAKGMENFEKCQRLNQAGKMVCERRKIIKKIRIHTRGICPHCGKEIEVRSDGFTRCPHCNSGYDQNGNEIYL